MTNFKIDDLRVISEVLDGEAIIIDLKSGTYYSLNETASVLWEKIKSQHSTEDIIKSFVNQYTADIVEIEKSIEEIVDFLKADSLIFEAETVESAHPKELVEVSKKPFIKPEIVRYEDMQEMLLADPIHDVDKFGWPAKKN